MGVIVKVGRYTCESERELVGHARGEKCRDGVRE